MNRPSRVRALKFSVFTIFLFLVRPASAQDSLRFQTEVNTLVAGDSAVNKRNVILFTGSSSIRFWATLKSDFPGHNVINRGFGGSEMTDLVSNKFLFMKAIMILVAEKTRTKYSKTRIVYLSPFESGYLEKSRFYLFHPSPVSFDGS